MGKIVVTDDMGNKKAVEGVVDGFVVKMVTKKHGVSGRVIGLDSSWVHRKVLVVLIAEETAKGWVSP